MKVGYARYRELSEKLLHEEIMNSHQFENLSYKVQSELIEELEMVAWQWRESL